MSEPFLSVQDDCVQLPGPLRADQPTVAVASEIGPPRSGG